MCRTSEAESDADEDGEAAANIVKLAAEPASPQRPRTFSTSERLEDLFELVSQHLGSGTFGLIAKVRDRRTGAECALKDMSTTADTNTDWVDREIAIHKQLDHPNIVALHSVFRSDLRVQLVMELCTGGELFDLVTEAGFMGFDDSKVVHYTKQLLGALSYLHKNKIAHRDLKLENILLSDKTPEAQIKLIDFGLSTSFEEGKPMVTRTGSSYYVAPEVLRCSYDERCDVWSAGVIAFMLCCADPPFDGDTNIEVLEKVSRGFFEFASPYWKAISAGTKGLIKQMLTKEPAKRPKVEELLRSSHLTDGLGAPFFARRPGEDNSMVCEAHVAFK